MKNWVLGFALIPFLSAPLPWSELESGRELLLTQKVLLGEHGPAFEEGIRLKFISSEPLALPGAPLLYLALEQSPCPHPGWESEIEIVVPRNNPDSSAVGIELSRNCRWGIYLEQKDLFQPSLFTNSEPGVPAAAPLR